MAIKAQNKKLGAIGICRGLCVDRSDVGDLGSILAVAVVEYWGQIRGLSLTCRIKFFT